MKIGGIDCPIVREDYESHIEFQCSLAIEDWNARMEKLGIRVPDLIQYTLFELMCTGAKKTVMGEYDETKNQGRPKDRDDPSEEPSR